MFLGFLIGKGVNDSYKLKDQDQRTQIIDMGNIRRITLETSYKDYDIIVTITILKPLHSIC